MSAPYISRSAVGLLVLAGCTARGIEAHPQPTPGGDSDTAWTPLFEDASVSLAPNDFPDLLLSFDVAVDVAHRRAWVTSLYQDVLGLVDIDSGTLLTVYTLPDEDYGLPMVAVDGDGDAWLATATGVVKVAPDGRSVAYPLNMTVRHIYGGPGDSVYVSGDDTAGAYTSTLVRLDGRGAIAASTTIPLAVTAIGPGPDGTVATATVDADELGQVLVWSADTLEQTGTCASLQPAGSVYPTAEGDFFVVLDDEVGYARCNGGTPISVMLGVENKLAVLADDDTVTVFDRIGESGGSHSTSVARRLDLDLNVTSTFPTGKHGGFGAVDTVTGNVWLNSEDTSAIQAYNPTTGAQTANVRLGTHVEAFAFSDTPGPAWLTGRLSSLVARVDFTSGAILRAVDAPVWPVAPLWRDDVLYVLDQVGGGIYVYDAETMGLRYEWPLAVDVNDDLDFSALAWSEARQSLLVANGASNLLLEIDPRTGAERARHALGGEAPDSTVIGRLEIGTHGQEAWVVRSSDSTATHIRLDTGAVTSAVLASTRDVEAAQYELAPKLTWLTGDATRLYYGTWAFDPQTFAAMPDDKLPGDRVFGEQDGVPLSWSALSGEVFHGDPAVSPDPVATIEVETGDPYVGWLDAWGEGLIFVDSGVAAARVRDVEL